MAALARPDGVPVRLALLDETALLRPGEHTFTRVLLPAACEVAGGLVHQPVRTDDHRLGKSVVAADLEVEDVVPGRDLERAGSELAVDPLVCDHRDPVLAVRNDHLAPDRVAIARIVRVHRHGDVGEDRRGPDRRDRDAVVPVAVRIRVADRHERVVELLVHHFEVGDRRLMERAPVHDAVRAVYPSLAPEPNEEGHDGAHVLVVHREALARVVEGGAEAAVLAHDRAARFLEPVPRSLDECLAAEVVSRQTLLRERFLDDVLRRDAGMVVSRLPEGVETAHPVPADQDVLQRAVQRVAEVQLTRDVGRRHADDIGVAAARPGAGRVQALAFPCLLPARLDGGRVIPRVHRAGV